ncbi:MAG: hypothetical protein LBQ66_12765, partial [Planctomycetaceae bacterium]|nr:hypothetical protein [Planctomycetaceae bacterium]
TPKVMLPVLKENKVGSYHWGLVAGRMLTQYLPHSKMEEADPKIWRHDLMHADGTPHQLLELILFRKLAGIKENSDETGNMIPHVGTPLLPISDNKPQTWFYTESEPPQDWMSLEFDDKNWKSGNAPFGKKEAQVDRFPQTEWNSKGIRLRHDFELTGAELKKIKQLVLLTHFDEDAVVYLNGRQIKNFAEYKYNAAYEAFALDADAVKLLRNGKNVLAVECKNTVGGQFIDVGLYAK